MRSCFVCFIMILFFLCFTSRPDPNINQPKNYEHPKNETPFFKNHGSVTVNTQNRFGTEKLGGFRHVFKSGRV